MLLQFLGDQLRQGVDAVHAEHQIHIGVALAQLFHNVFLVGHAAAQSDDEAGLFFLKALQRAHVAEHPLLGVLTHGAGVEQDQVGILGLIAQAVADIHQHAFNALAVVDVLLAAVAAHIRQRRCLIERRQRLGGGIVVGVGQFFQVNFSLYKRPNGRTYPNIPY